MKAYQYLLLLITCVIASCSSAKDRKFPPLHEASDPALQSALEASLKIEMDSAFVRAIKEKKASVVLVDITNLHHPKVAAVNGDEMMYAASLSKLAILLGAFVQVERGKMVLDDQTRAACMRMIRYSSNEDASAILNRVGMDNLAEILQSERFRLYDPKFNGGLWVGKDFSAAPARKRDPLHQISHGATAMQAARYYYMLFSNRLVSPKLTKEMKEILSKPALAHKFVKGLSGRPNIKIYRKSGTWKNWHADSGVIVHENFKYIIVALSHIAHGDEKLSRLASAVDDLMKHRHTVS